MRPIHLTSDLELGHPVIDDEHRKLLGFADQLSNAIEASRPKHEISLRMALLADSTETHFRSEEDLMLANGFSQYGAHRLDHDRLMKELYVSRQKVESGVIPPPELLAFFICAWATHHIATFDLEFVEHLKSLPPSKGDGSIVA